jgi:hypothetical protein
LSNSLGGRRRRRKREERSSKRTRLGSEGRGCRTNWSRERVSLKIEVGSESCESGGGSCAQGIDSFAIFRFHNTTFPGMRESSDQLERGRSPRHHSKARMRPKKAREEKTSIFHQPPSLPLFSPLPHLLSPHKPTNSFKTLSYLSLYYARTYTPERDTTRHLFPPPSHFISFDFLPPLVLLPTILQVTQTSHVYEYYDHES